MNNISICIDNKHYEIDHNLIEHLNQFGVNVDEKYISNLLSFRFPSSNELSNNELYDLIYCDLCNKYIHSPNNLGKILKYCDNKIIAVYDSLCQVVVESKYADYLYGFESLHELNFMPHTEKYDFFGVSMNRISNNVYIEKLNWLIQKIHSDDVLEKYNKYYINDNLSSNMTILEYKKRVINHHAFSLGNLICEKSNQLTEMDNRNNIDISLYDAQLEKLLSRYSYYKQSAFECVENLNDYQNVSGLYILCFDYERRYYIGLTKKSIKSRILQHFRKPNSDFDRTHRAYDISNIYVLRVSPENVETVETDCISVIDKGYLLNVTAGGQNSMPIKHDAYEKCIDYFRLSKREISNIAKYALNNR